MSSAKTDFQRLNMEVQEKLDCALQQFQEMKMERDNAVRMLHKYQRSRSLEGIVEDDQQSEVVDVARTRLNHVSQHQRHHGDDDDEEEEEEEEEDEYVWEVFNVVLNQENGQGFGMSIKGGKDEPYFFNGDPSIVVTDVIKSGPADGKLKVGDQLQSINDLSLDNIDRSTVLSIFRESGHSINLVVRRRVLLPGRRLDHPLRVTLVRKNKREEFGLVLGFKMYVRSITPNSLADMEGNIRPGDTLLEIQNIPVDNLSFNEAIRQVEKTKDKLKLLVNKKIRTLVQGNHPHVRNKCPRSRKSSLPVPRLAPDPPECPQDSLKSDGPRLICLSKDGGRGITLAGGNKTGIFVRKVDLNSVPHQLGLVEGDLILKINDTEMFGKTREEAVLMLLSGTSKEGMTLLVQHRRRDYERLLVESSTSSGDLFYVRSTFSCEGSDHGILAIQRGDVFQVVDSIPSGVIGSWKAVKVMGAEVKIEETDGKRKGAIPNMNRAHQMALSSLILHKDSNQAVKKGGTNPFRRRPKSGHGSGGFSPSTPDTGLLQQPYDRVALKNVPQRRPVVLCGVLSDVVARKLIAERPEKFEIPEITFGSEGAEAAFVKYTDVQSVIDKGKHALLNLDVPSVDRLWRTPLPPIVVCLKAESKQVVRESLQLWDKIHKNSSPSLGSSEALKSPKKIFEQFHDFEKHNGYMLSCVVSLSAGESWLKDLEEKINELQKDKAWINETVEPMDEDEILRIASNQFSCSSNPKPSTHKSSNDLEGHDKAQGGTLTRSSSDPNLLKQGVSAIRYLPSYTMAATLKSRKKSSSSKGQLGRSNGFSGHQDHQHNHRQQINNRERSFSNALPGEKSRIKSIGDSQPRSSQRAEASPEVRQPDNQGLHQSSRQRQIFTPTYLPQPNGNQTDQESVPQQPQNGNGYHKRQHSNTYYPVFSPQTSSSTQNQSSPEGASPKYNPLTHPLHHRQQSDQLQTGKDANGHDGGVQKSFNKWNCNGSSAPGRPSRKSWHEEKLVKMGELSLAEETEIPIGPEAELYSRPFWDQRVQAPPFHQRCSSSSSSSTSAIKTTQMNHLPLQPSITSPFPSVVGPPTSSGHSNGVTFKNQVDVNLRHPHLSVNGQTRNLSLCNASNVIAQARGVFNSSGGILDSKETGVKIIIPKGALPQGVDQEIYFKVCRDTNSITPLDKARGEALLSPLVMCGPQGLKFLKPLELHIPHTTSVDLNNWSLSVKSSDSPNGDPKSWHQIRLEQNNNSKLVASNQNTVSFLVDKF